MFELIAGLIGAVATIIGAILTRPKDAAVPINSPFAKRSFAQFAALVVVVGVACSLLIGLVTAAAKKGLNTGGYKTPAGTVAAYMGKVAPPGWLPCDGTKIPPEDEELIKIVGENTPNMRGRFLRGLDPTGTIDIDGGANRALGSPQEDAFKQHTHPVSNVLTGGRYNHVGGGPNECAFATATAGDSPTGGTETRPKNTAVNFIIKY